MRDKKLGKETDKREKTKRRQEKGAQERIYMLAGTQWVTKEKKKNWLKGCCLCQDTDEETGKKKGKGV